MSINCFQIRDRNHRKSFFLKYQPIVNNFYIVTGHGQKQWTCDCNVHMISGKRCVVKLKETKRNNCWQPNRKRTVSLKSLKTFHVISGFFSEFLSQKFSQSTWTNFQNPSNSSLSWRIHQSSKLLQLNILLPSRATVEMHRIFSSSKFCLQRKVGS